MWIVLIRYVFRLSRRHSASARKPFPKKETQLKHERVIT